MRIISIKTLRNFWQNIKFKDSEQPLIFWCREVKKDKWKGPIDIKHKYGSASILMNNRVVFNIKGNKYRLVVRINYRIGGIFIRFIGTHEEYNKINSKEI
ncbi:MAG: type II toxin-antitoxin system HigB family toxin [Candidatus Paceibacterota bacterium]|jgi:mRNA interferase HigB